MAMALLRIGIVILLMLVVMMVMTAVDLFIVPYWQDIATILSFKGNHIMILSNLVTFENDPLPMIKDRPVYMHFIVKGGSCSYWWFYFWKLFKDMSMNVWKLQSKCCGVFRYRIYKLRPLFIQNIVITNHRFAI